MTERLEKVSVKQSALEVDRSLGPESGDNEKHKQADYLACLAGKKKPIFTLILILRRKAFDF
ncbi:MULTISPECIES: hypothetical protein [unclassified Caballeronia]|uniref:hypothetical protein n=1 Tax=unclassified Caballeronia TaxID=2646786 RepID=UPI0028631CB6|nr:MULTISPECIES: hypothetical protein [unclassified Caballeronia]MDR5771937.1 hypothetical protein [Caballeronia sp. LZ002]MDR5847371.1 hypothetical protein [Caballeronia sp. LZ003]